MSGAKAITQGNHPPSPAEWFIEPVWTVTVLLEWLKLPRGTVVYDPACGCGTIPKTCQNAGLLAIGTDKHQRGFGNQQDFLELLELPHPADWLVSNPPFSLATNFVERAYALGIGKVALVLRLAFLEGETRNPWLKASGLKHVLVLSKRASMPPGELFMRGEIEAKGGSTPYAWFLFDRTYVGWPMIDWLLPSEQKADLDLGAIGL